MAKSVQGVWQAGDGRRYKVNTTIVQQIVAGTAGSQMKNKHSKISTDLSPSGWFGGVKKFQSVEFDRRKSEGEYQSQAMGLYNSFWQSFQANGDAAVRQLLTIRRQGKVHAEMLQEKFATVAATNASSLSSLDNQVSTARFFRDGAFICLAVGATMGAGAAVGGFSAGTAQAIMGGTAVTKAGAKLIDLNAEGKLTAQGMDGAFVIVDFAADLMFGMIGLSQAEAAKTGMAMTAKQAFILIVSVKAPLEMCKAAAGGGSLAQIAVAGGFEVAAPVLDLFKGAMINKLIPGALTAGQSMLTGSVDSLLGLGKDAAMNAVAPKTGGGGFNLPGLISGIASHFSFLNLTDDQFIRRYVVVPVS